MGRASHSTSLDDGCASERSTATISLINNAVLYVYTILCAVQVHTSMVIQTNAHFLPPVQRDTLHDACRHLLHRQVLPTHLLDELATTNQVPRHAHPLIPSENAYRSAVGLIAFVASTSHLLSHLGLLSTAATQRFGHRLVCDLNKPGAGHSACDDLPPKLKLLSLVCPTPYIFWLPFAILAWTTPWAKPRRP